MAAMWHRVRGNYFPCSELCCCHLQPYQCDKILSVDMNNIDVWLTKSLHITCVYRVALHNRWFHAAALKGQESLCYDVLLAVLAEHWYLSAFWKCQKRCRARNHSARKVLKTHLQKGIWEDVHALGGTELNQSHRRPSFGHQVRAQRHLQQQHCWKKE